MITALRVAILCGLLPLVGGTAIFVTWLFTRQEGLMVLGAITILIGIVFFLCGVFALFLHLERAKKRNLLPRHTLVWQGVIVGALLLLNFPVAAAYCVVATDLWTRYEVVVTNRSKSTLDSFIIDGPGVHRELGPLPSSGQTTVVLRFDGDGSLTYQAKYEDLEHKGTILNYVTGPGGHKVECVVNEQRLSIPARETR